MWILSQLEITWITRGTLKLKNIFTKLSHHLNMSIIFIVQNLYEKTMRTISLNAGYIVLFNNPRDSLQATTLGTQIFGRGKKLLQKAYKDISQTPHSYVMVDLTQTCEPCAKVRTKIFPDEHNVFYVAEGTSCSENLNVREAVSSVNLS